MSTLDIKVTGLDGLNAQLMELKAQTAAKVLASAARKAFKPVLDAAKQMVPVRSGALRDALKMGSAKNHEGDAIVNVGIYVGRTEAVPSDEMPPARRWHFIELGTAHMPAQPFLRPALDENASAVVEGLKDVLAEKIAVALAKASKGPR